MRILVTGEHEGLESISGIEWVPLRVLEFQRLSVDPALLERLTQKPVDWIIFTSRTSVKFWGETLLEYGTQFPVETQVACIGEKTAQLAEQDGFTADFYPTEPGTETFVEEFSALIANYTIKPSVFIPVAENHRRTLELTLRRLGCEVLVLPLYRTLPRRDLKDQLNSEQLAQLSAVVFTSPSSVDAFLSEFSLPSKIPVVALGQYTGKALLDRGFADRRILPFGDFKRIEEVLW